MNFKELGEYGKALQVIKYERLYSLKQMFPKDLPEILLVGRSNVGKSSLINTLLNHKIAKTSKQPGCTKWIGYIRLPNLVLIDLPGYGYAKVAKGRKAFWNEMILEYINSHRSDQVWILIDARRGIQEMDSSIVELFNFCNVRYIFTKSDQKGSFVPDDFLGVSAHNGNGILQLRQELSSYSEKL